ncbi:MAG: DUF2568 domain-containing protein [Chloroflexi bacterium]|nr:MAG: DUF2568 domain-containing protein [Chloroflexota bacterium]
MSLAYHPINLAGRFFLELVMLTSFGFYGWQVGHSIALSLLLAMGLPLLAAVLWGVFAVPGDRSRSGKAPIPVPGTVRLMLELLLFGGATWVLYLSGFTLAATGFGLIVFLHYLLSYERVIWLMSHERKRDSHGGTSPKTL